MMDQVSKERVIRQLDLDWEDERKAWGWQLPDPATLPWRAWGVRHVRAALHIAWIYLLFEPLQPDWRALWRAHWVAYAIRRGWC
jgi:hypothetical protein